jgi:hypothetical protein
MRRLHTDSQCMGLKSLLVSGGKSCYKWSSGVRNVAAVEGGRYISKWVIRTLALTARLIAVHLPGYCAGKPVLTARLPARLPDQEIT